MKKKRIISIAVTLGLLLGVAVFAATQISDIAQSTISSSNVKIEVQMFEEKDGKEATVSGETEIKPGDEVSRIAKVKNTGDQPAWVRVKANLIINEDSVPAAYNQYIELTGVNTTDWEWKDGYWYYNKPLASGETSSELFTGVKINDTVENEFDGTNLKVDGEGTQVKNNGSTVFEAKGWTTE